jgi:hypothetical protein
MLSTKAPTKSERSEKVQQKSEIKDESKDKPKEQTKEQSKEQPIINVFNQSSDNTMIIDHDQINKKFILKSSGNVIGYFSAKQILKYLNQDVEGYLLSEDLNISQPIIEKYLINNGTLLSHLESPITGNIDILIKIYKDIQETIQQIQGELEKLDEKTIEQIQTKNKKFIYDILSHIVKLFTLYSNTVPQTKVTPELQTSILKYTAGAIYRLISILHEDVDQLHEKINKSKSECDEMVTVKRKVDEKIKTFEESLKIQNEKIDKIIENMGKVNQETNKYINQETNTESLQIQQTNTNTNINTNTNPSIQLGGNITSIDTPDEVERKTLSITSAISSAFGGGSKKSIRLSTILNSDENSDKTISFNNFSK